MTSVELSAFFNGLAWKPGGWSFLQFFLSSVRRPTAIPLMALMHFYEQVMSRGWLRFSVTLPVYEKSRRTVQCSAEGRGCLSLSASQFTVASYYHTLMSEHSTAALEGVREQHSRGQQRAEGDGGKIQIPSKNSYFWAVSGILFEYYFKNIPFCVLMLIFLPHFLHYKPQNIHAFGEKIFEILEGNDSKHVCCLE